MYIHNNILNVNVFARGLIQLHPAIMKHFFFANINIIVTSQYYYVGRSP